MVLTFLSSPPLPPRPRPRIWARLAPPSPSRRIPPIDPPPDGNLQPISGIYQWRHPRRSLSTPAGTGPPGCPRTSGPPAASPPATAPGGRGQCRVPRIKFGPSAAVAAAAAAPSASPDMCRSSLSHAGRSISSRTISSSGSSIHGRRPSSGSASKPTLARAKSEKVTVTSQRPPALAVPLSNSFKDMARTVAASKSSSALLKNKLSPRPCADKGVASPKPNIQRVPSPGPVRGGKPLPVSSARAPGVGTKKREAADGGASASSRPKGAPQRAVEPSATRKEQDDEPSMQFEESESLTTPSIEDQLQEQLPDPVDLKSIDIAASGPARRDELEPYCEQQGNNVEDHSEKEDAGCGELHNGGHGADASGESKPDIAKVADELDRAETEEVKAKAAIRAEVAQSWRKDDPKSNDVIEETKSKLLEERKSRVKALVGAFETVMSFKE